MVSLLGITKTPSNTEIKISLPDAQLKIIFDESERGNVVQWLKNNKNAVVTKITLSENGPSERQWLKENKDAVVPKFKLPENEQTLLNEVMKDKVAYFTNKIPETRSAEVETMSVLLRILPPLQPVLNQDVQLTSDEFEVLTVGKSNILEELQQWYLEKFLQHNVLKKLRTNT